jgi:gliding motility-associatede transport system auxiliary component
MQVTPRSRRRVQFQNFLFTILFVAAMGLLAWVSTQYDFHADWTYGHRNSLSPASVKLLGTLKQPLTATAYARANSPYRDPLKRFFANYQAVKPDIHLVFVDPDRDPERVRADGITAEGQVILKYGDRVEKLDQINEAQLADAIQRLERASDRYVVFLAGDGERNPSGEHNFDMGDFGKQLTDKGFKLEPLNLAANVGVPDNTAVLVIAGPQADVFPGMVKLVRDYVRRGGNLLWLGDPGSLYGLDPLAADLGIHFGDGTIVDPNTQLLSINDPTITLVAKYPEDSPVVSGLSVMTLFPGATSVVPDKDSTWQQDEFLQTLPRSWLTTAKLAGSVAFDPKRGDKQGPLPIGVALTRAVAGKGEQRAIVVGDGDFLSNAYIGNAGNLDLGLDIMNWVAHDDSFIDINPRPAPDLSLSLSPTAQLFIGFGFLAILPLLLLFAGITVWMRRRRR